MAVYALISETTYHAFGTDPNVRTARFSVTCYGAIYADAKTAVDQVCAQLERYRATVQGLEIIDVLKDLEIDGFDDEAQVYHTMVDFIVHHRN